jgi:hypothetical protein
MPGQKKTVHATRVSPSRVEHRWPFHFFPLPTVRTKIGNNLEDSTFYPSIAATNEHKFNIEPMGYQTQLLSFLLSFWLGELIPCSNCQFNRVFPLALTFKFNLPVELELDYTTYLFRHRNVFISFCSFPYPERTRK